MGRISPITLSAVESRLQRAGEAISEQGGGRPVMSPELIEIARCLAQISEDLHALVQIIRVNEIFVMANAGGGGPPLSVGDVVAALSRGHEEAD